MPDKRIITGYVISNLLNIPVSPYRGVRIGMARKLSPQNEKSKNMVQAPSNAAISVINAKIIESIRDFPFDLLKTRRSIHTRMYSTEDAILNIFTPYPKSEALRLIRKHSTKEPIARMNHNIVPEFRFIIPPAPLRFCYIDMSRTI